MYIFVHLHVCMCDLAAIGNWVQEQSGVLCRESGKQWSRSVGNTILIGERVLCIVLLCQVTYTYTYRKTLQYILEGRCHKAILPLMRQLCIHMQTHLKEGW